MQIGSIVRLKSDSFPDLKMFRYAIVYNNSFIKYGKLRYPLLLFRTRKEAIKHTPSDSCYHSIISTIDYIIETGEFNDYWLLKGL